METILSANRLRRPTAAAVVFCLCSLIALGPTSVRSDTPVRPFNQMHQAGIRLGGWSNSGDKPPTSETQGDLSLSTDFKGGAFYFEGFVALRLSPLFMGELSLGIFNRGDVNLRDNVYEDQFYGNLLIYPMLLRAKFYPLGATSAKLQPYLSAGGGFYYGHHNIQFYQSNVVFSGFNTQSATSFEYTLGGGADLPIASHIALEANASWMPLRFGRDLITIRNYDGLAITVGIKYLFSSLK
jgi:opacity protein-like surface antigen